jgi:uncharacterized protein with PQ loop repeat
MTGSLSLALPSYPVDAAPLWVDALAGMAGGLGILSQWPQVWRLWRSRQYVGLSTLSCVLNLLTPLCWFTYGVVQGSGVQMILNGLALVGSGAVLTGLVVRARLRLRQWLPALAAGATVVVAVGIVGGPAFSGALASLVTLSMALPQVWLLLRGRIAGTLDASGVSQTRWRLSAICNVGWFSYGLLVTDVAIGITSGAMVISSVLVLVLCAGRSGRRAVETPVLAVVGGPVEDAPTDAEQVASRAEPAKASGSALPADRVACSP